MESEPGPMQKQDAFLDALGDNLKAKEGADIDLAEILKTHILKISPSQNAVEQAKDAILKLADNRAKQATKKANNG